MEEKIKIYSFFGPPGTGKGTVAQKCAKDLDYIMLSTGDLSRKHIQEGTDLGVMLQEYVNKGQLIPDDLITQMVFDWLKSKIVEKKPIILDGFPRTKGQASLLIEALKSDPDFSNSIFKVVNFDLIEEEIIKRISSRITCSNKECQEVYNTIVKVPTETGICDLCGSPLSRRPDDDPAIVRERLKVFARFKDDLLGFYHDVGQTVIHFAIPEGPPETVFKMFSKILA